MEEETNNKKVAITTFDNPFNPFKDYDSWLMFDIEKGYNTCGYLGRIARTTDQMSDAEDVLVKEYEPFILSYIATMFFGVQFESIDKRRLKVVELTD